MSNNVGGCRIKLRDELCQINICKVLLARTCPVAAFTPRTSPSQNSILEFVITLRSKGISIAQQVGRSVLLSVGFIPRTVSITIVGGCSVPSRNDIHGAFDTCYRSDPAEASVR